MGRALVRGCVVQLAVLVLLVLDLVLFVPLTQWLWYYFVQPHVHERLSYVAALIIVLILGQLQYAILEAVIATRREGHG